MVADPLARGVLADMRAEERGGDLPDDDGPSRADADGLVRRPLPDPYRCDDPWCRSAGQGTHLHGTRPDGVRV